MTIHISYTDKVMTPEERAAQSAESADAEGTQYSLLMQNQSNQAWTFYVYQKEVKPLSNNIFSLAWFCSPYKIRVGANIRFTWEIDYSFVWSDTGPLSPGVYFTAGASQPCDPKSDNTTTFSMTGGGPVFSPSWPGQPEGTLVITDDSSIPTSSYSVGIGMGGNGTFAVQAELNLAYLFKPTPTYWVAAGQNMHFGEVLSADTITQTSQVQFPTGVYDMSATLNTDNSWDIVSG